MILVSSSDLLSHTHHSHSNSNSNRHAVAVKEGDFLCQSSNRPQHMRRHTHTTYLQNHNHTVIYVQLNTHTHTVSLATAVREGVWPLATAATGEVAISHRVYLWGHALGPTVDSHCTCMYVYSYHLELMSGKATKEYAIQFHPNPN